MDQRSAFSVAALREEKKAEDAQIARQMTAVRRKYRAFFLRQERDLIKRLRRVLKDNRQSSIHRAERGGS